MGIKRPGCEDAVGLVHRSDEFGRLPFEGDDDVVDLAQILGRERENENAFARKDADEAVLLQAYRRLVHRRAAHAEA